MIISSHLYMVSPLIECQEINSETKTTSFLPSGTFCSLDICLAQLEELGTLNVFQTVSRMRTQRAFSIQTPEQYYFCYKAILEFAEREGMVPPSHNLLAMEGQ